jgi:hypothetical protein
MPIQPGLALQVKGLELPDPLAMQAQATQIQNALQQQRMGEMQIQNAMREQRRAQELRDIMSGFAPDAPAPEVAGRLQRGGFFQEAGQTLQQAALRDKAAREAQAARFTEIKTKAELAGRIFSGVADQGSYATARARAIQQGLVTADEIPEAYDKTAVDQIVRNAIEVPKALELEFKGRQTAAQEATARAAGVRAQAAVSQATTAADRAAFERTNAGRDKGARPQLLMLQDALADLEAAGQGDTERAQQIRNQIRASTSKGAVELSPKDVQAREAKYPQATLALRTFDEKTDELISDLQTLKNHPGLSGITGLIAGRTPAVTGDARNAKAILDKILARGGFQELQNLRNASPTGGALGQVSNTENQFLRQAFGTLDPVQDTKDFKRGVDQVIRELEGSKSRVRDAYDLTYEYRAGQAPAAPGESRSATRRGTALGAESGAPAQVKSDADYDKLPSGTMFKGPDGVLRRKP